MALDYSQTLDYLFERLPMFQRIGAAAYKADLDNTIFICNFLDNPQHKFQSIHIAGTNGKGSTSHLLAAILQSKGLKTGLYTSPHLKDFRERIRINGKMIAKNYITTFVKKYKSDFEKISPSFFEWTVGLAFNYFADQKVDIAVIETGLGGRLDSTNVITPLVSIITNISFDHTNLLGNTLKKIAIEKAGIIKTNVPVVIGETQKSVQNIFLKIGKEKRAKIFFSDKAYKAKARKKYSSHGDLILDIKQKEKPFLDNLHCELNGLYQLKNVSTVLATVDELNKLGFGISQKNIRAGIGNVKSLTGLRGRWELISEKPLTLADTAHNEAGIKEVLKQIKQIPHRRLFFVLGMVGDKDISKMLKLFPQKAEYFFCKASVPRALDAKELSVLAKKYGLKGNIFEDVKSAMKSAQKKAGEGDLVFIGGSTFTVADAV